MLEIENENELVIVIQARWQKDYEIQDYKYKCDVYKYNFTKHYNTYILKFQQDFVNIKNKSPHFLKARRLLGFILPR